MAAPVFTITQGNTQPALRLTLQDAGGPVALPSGTTVTFDMRVGSTLQITDGTCTVIDGPGGVVEYAWQAGDTALVGQYQGKMTAHWPGGGSTSFPTNKTATDNYVTINVVDDAKAVN